MIILTIRTDKPIAEVGLYDGETQLAYEQWQAHRALAETIHSKIYTLLTEQKMTWQDLGGVLAFQGPGSFTGLRIGLTVANALAQGLGVPVLAAREPEWIATGVKKLLHGENDQVVLPYYGAPVHITTQKK